MIFHEGQRLFFTAKTLTKMLEIMHGLVLLSVQRMNSFIRIMKKFKHIQLFKIIRITMTLYFTAETKVFRKTLMLGMLHQYERT